MAVDEKGEKVALKTFKIFDMEEADVSIWFLLLQACMEV